MKMPFRDFAPRRRRFQLPSEPLSRAEGTGALLKALELSQRAGAVIQPIADEFRIPVDFKSGSNGRVDLETGTYVLLAASASQRSRLENLIPRMLSRIRTAGLPIQAMDVRIRPRRQAHESERTPAEAPRPVEKSISGAAALREEAARTQNEDLARELRELARWVTPSDAEFPSVFSAALGRDLMRASEAIEQMQQTLEAMPASPDPKLVPSEAAAAADPQLARLRARMLERGAELERAKTPIADLLGEFDDAIARAAPWLEAPDDSARPTLEAEYLDWRKHLAALLEAVDDAVRAGEALSERSERSEPARHLPEGLELDESLETDDGLWIESPNASTPSALRPRNSAAPSPSLPPEAPVPEVAPEDLRRSIRAAERRIRSSRERALEALSRILLVEAPFPTEERPMLPPWLESARAADEAPEALPKSDRLEALHGSLGRISSELDRRVDALDRMEEVFEADLERLRDKRRTSGTLLEIDRALPERLELVRQTDEEIETLIDGLRIIEEAFRPGTSDGSTNPHDDELVRKVLEAQAILAESAGAVPAGPDLRNIPDEEAASADPKLMDVRLRLLARFDDVRRRRLLLVEAMRDAAAVLQKYRREGVIETAAAQAVLAKAKRAASAARTVQSPDV